MNKKFSTLVACLLLAGAWTTADAKLTKPTEGPKVGSSYVIGSAVNETTGTVTHGLGTDATVTAAETTVKEFGKEWTLEKANIEGVKNAFYLKSAEGYLGLTDAAAGGDIELKSTEDDACAFVYDATAKQFKLAKEYNGTYAPANAVLVDDTGLKVVGSVSSETPLGTVAVFSAPLDYSNNKLLTSIGGDYYFIGQEVLTLGTVTNVLVASGDDAATFTTANADVDANLWKKVSETTTISGVTYVFQNKKYPKCQYQLVTETAYKSGFGDGTNVYGVYRSPLTAQSGKALNEILGEGFTLTFKVDKDSKKEIELTDAFAGTLTAVVADGSGGWKLAEAGNTEFKIKSGKKFLALKDADNNITGVEGEFVLITEKELNENGDKYITNFSVESYCGEDQTIVNRFKAVGDDTYYAYIVTPSATTKAYLTAIEDGSLLDEKYPYISLNDNNFVELEDLVHTFWNISYADTKANAKEDGEEYKYGRVLAVEDEGTGVEPAYVLANTVSLSSPETQWAVVAVNAAGKVTLQNRETKKQITDVTFRYTEKDNVWKMYSSDDVIDGSDLVKVTNVADFDKFDGFKAYKESEIRNNDFYLGQYHAVDGNHHAYFVENHKQSHQIGMTAEEGKADKWNLHFATKEIEDENGDLKTVVDTVFVETLFLTLDANGKVVTDAKEIKKSKLAIIPYYFQKVANREYVKYDNTTGNKFYACDEKENEDDNAVRFALKQKIDGAYNFVEITCNGDAEEDEADVLGESKIYVANSADKGSLKKMDTYAEDNNSLMVVTEAEAPEYHLVSEGMWGDTITLARKENAAQVLYEKFDAKSVVENDTLSFLNIDNVNQFNVNPAIFADTAYINRGTKEDPNTCYQYLLAVRHSYGYHIDGCGVPGHEQNVGGIDTVYGDFLINLVDTANLYNDIHNNWYINEVEAGEKLTKLSFVTGFHTNDTLYIVKADNDTVKIGMDTPDFNVAKFAFRYTDSDAKTFKIQTQWKKFYENMDDTAEEVAEYYEENATNPDVISNEGYLKWINGTVVVTNGFENGDEFVITERVDRDPVANEDITTSSISVIASEGKVIINGAAGKKVAISNVLGQTIANAVLSSDNATIAAPAGVVVVAVEGEAAVKAIVK
mgnify:CR=1 FL=1